MHPSTAKFIAPISFKRGEQFRIDDDFYSLEHRLGSRLEFRRIDTGEIRQMPSSEFYSLWSGRRIVKLGNSPFDPDHLDCVELNLDSFRTLSEDDQKVAWNRLPFVLAIDRMLAKGWRQNDENLKKLSKAVAVVVRWPGGRRKAPSPASLRRWFKPWLASGRLLGALAPNFKARGRRPYKYSEEELRILDEELKKDYVRWAGVTGVALRKNVNARIHDRNERDGTGKRLKPITQSKVYRVIHELDPYETTLIRQGEASARAKYGVCGIREKSEHINAIWESDHSPADFLVLDDESEAPLGIPYITLARDDFSRMPTGFAITFSHPSCLSLGKCLVHAITPKGYLKESFPEVTHDWPAAGSPFTVKADNAWEFHSERFAKAAYSQGIKIKFMHRRRPWLKGMIENAFKTIHEQLTHILPGTTLANYVARDGQDATKYAIIRWSQFISIFHKYVVDEWIREMHRTTLRTPYDTWMENHPEKYVRLPADIDMLRFDFAKRIPGVALRHDGVQFQYLSFRSSALSELRHDHQGDVTLLVDEDDLTRLAVEIPDGRRVLADCSDPRYAKGLTLPIHQAIVRQLKERDRDPRREEDRYQQRLELLELIDQAIGKGKGWGNRRAAKLSGKFSSWRTTNPIVSPIFDATAPAEPARPSSPAAAQNIAAPKSGPASYGHDAEGEWGVEQRTSPS